MNYWHIFQAPYMQIHNLPTRVLTSVFTKYGFQNLHEQPKFNLANLYVQVQDNFIQLAE